MSEPTTIVDRERGIIVREGRVRWRWTFSRKLYDGWTLRDQGLALTRRGAVRAVQRRMLSTFTWVGQLDRMEIEAARQHSFTVDEHPAAPAPELVA